VTAFKPGDRVRFRLGERMTYTMACCGVEIDQFAIMVDCGFIEGIFTIGYIHSHDSPYMCEYCRTGDLENPGFPPIVLKHPFVYRGSLRRGFGAYPEELEPAPEASGQEEECNIS